MNKSYVFTVSEKTRHINLLKSLSEEVECFLHLHKKNLGWLMFAKSYRDGFKIFDHCELQWSSLEKIAMDVGRNYPEYRIGEIIDILSLLVNTRVSDVVRQHQLLYPDNLCDKECEYLKMPLIKIVGQDYYVPRYPWFVGEKGNRNNFTVKDILSKRIISVNKIKRNNHFIYLLSPEKINFW